MLFVIIQFITSIVAVALNIQVLIITGTIMKLYSCANKSAYGTTQSNLDKKEKSFRNYEINSKRIMSSHY